MAYSSIHFASVRWDEARPKARVDADGQAFLTVEDGEARVTFSAESADQLAAYLYSLPREVVRAANAKSAWPEAGRAAPMLPEPLMESRPSYFGDPDARPFWAQHAARRAMSSEDAQDAPSGPDGMPDVPVAAAGEAAS